MKPQDRSLIQVTLVISAILATLAISAGVIAFFAHNWDSFSKSVRLLLSFIPILSGIYIFYRAFFEHYDSKVWMESAGAYMVLMTGSSTALITQVYHIGEFDTILLVWMLLSLPVLYLAKSSSVTIIYLAGITWWLVLQNFEIINFRGGFNVKPTVTMGYWLLILAVVPHFYQFVKPGTQTVRSIILGWFSVVIILFAANMGFVVHFTIGYAMAITTAYVIGKYLFYNGKYFWNRPLQSVAVYATIIMSLFLSNNYVLFYTILNNNYGEMETGSRYRDDIDFSPNADTTAGLFSLVLLLGFILIIAYFVAKDYSEHRRLNPTLVVFPFVVVFGLMFAVMQHDPKGLKMSFFLPSLENKYVLAKIWFNLYVLVVGGHYLYQGIKQKINGCVILGMFIICNLLVWRYFDMQINYMLKAVLYIGFGVALLLFNKFYTAKMLDEKTVE